MWQWYQADFDGNGRSLTDSQQCCSKGRTGFRHGKSDGGSLNEGIWPCRKCRKRNGGHHRICGWDKSHHHRYRRSDGRDWEDCWCNHRYCWTDRPSCPECSHWSSPGWRCRSWICRSRRWSESSGSWITKIGRKYCNDHRKPAEKIPPGIRVNENLCNRSKNWKQSSRGDDRGI